jgi:DNA (cytosine-5)-methyltransferase 1
MLNSLEKQTPKIGLFSFFSGAGFLDLGFEMTEGFETLFVNEYHEPFLDIYKSSRTNLKITEPQFGYNAKSIATFLDTRGSQFLGHSIDEAKVTHDLIGFIGGPPCPDFSVGGKNKGIEGRTGNFLERMLN